jgi:hypothetical protein
MLERLYINTYYFNEGIISQFNKCINNVINNNNILAGLESSPLILRPFIGLLDDDR